MKPKVIILIALMAVAVAVIMSTYGDVSTSATFTQAEEQPNKDFHITGDLVKSMPVEYDPIKDPNYFVFYIKDMDGEIRKVVSHEPQWQDFERTTNVTMVGTAMDDHFLAKKVMPKCPSKYENEMSETTAQNQ